MISSILEPCMMWGNKLRQHNTKFGIRRLCSMKNSKFVGFVRSVFGLIVTMILGLGFLASAGDSSIQIVDQGNLAIQGQGPVVRSARLMSSGKRTKPVFMEAIPLWGYTAFGPHAVKSVASILDGDRELDLGFRLLPEYLMSSSIWVDYNTQTTFWVAMVAWSEEGFYPSDLEFQVGSSDTGNSFKKLEDYGTANYLYSETVIGIANGQRVPAGTPWNSVKVNTFAFLGSAVPVAKVTNQAEADGFTKWLYQQPPPFSVTATWRLREDGEVIASASRKLQLTGRPKVAQIHISAGTIHTEGDQGITFFVEKASSLSGPWTIVAQVTGRQSFAMSKDGQAGFYRTRSP